MCPRQNANIVPSMGIKTFSKNVSYKIKKTLAGLEWCPRQNSNIVPSMGIKTFSKNVSYKIKKTLAGLEWCPRQNSNIVPSMGIKTFSKNVSYKIKKTLAGLEWCPRQNSNLQPFAPQANALSNCATGTFLAYLIYRLEAESSSEGSHPPSGLIIGHAMVGVAE